VDADCREAERPRERERERAQYSTVAADPIRIDSSKLERFASEDGERGSLSVKGSALVERPQR
jgi:hypothetical protein